MNYENKDDAVFYKNFGYRNEKEYLEKLMGMNISPAEINNKDILDYGCGTGDASFYFTGFSPLSVRSIDIGERNINFANRKKEEKKLQNLEFIRSDLNSYDLGENKYDLIWSDTVVEFIRKPLELIIDDFKRALKPGGICYISFIKKDLFNIIIYGTLKPIKVMWPEKLRFIFYYLILPQYYLTKLFKKKFTINHEELKNKINYLFTPHVRLMSEKAIRQILERKGFKVLYIRDRIKSDISSSPHLEVKAVNTPL